MYNFEYDIKLNDEGRPYIDLDEEFDNNPEHKFAAMELTVYMLIAVLNERKKMMDEDEEIDFDEDDIEGLEAIINYLLNISDEMAYIIKNSMKSSNEIYDFLKSINVSPSKKDNNKEDNE